jgi:hypothetical protein
MKHLEAEVQRFELSLSRNLNVGFEKNFNGFLTSQFLIEICCITILPACKAASFLFFNEIDAAIYPACKALAI